MKLMSVGSVFAVVMGLFALPAFAATPVAVWDGDFTKTISGYTLNLNGNSVADGVITIGQAKGVTVDFANAMNDTGMTVMFKYSDLTLDSKKTIATSCINSNKTGDRTGVYLHYDNRAGEPDGIWNTTGTYRDGCWAVKMTSSQLSGTFAFTYKGGSGTCLYRIADGSRSDVFTCAKLHSADDHNIYGCAVGGTRAGSTFAAATGLKISAIAVFNSVLSEAEMKSYVFPSDQKLSKMYANRLSTGEAVIPGGTYGAITVPGFGYCATSFAAATQLSNTASGEEITGSYAQIIHKNGTGETADTDIYSHTLCGWFKLDALPTGSDLTTLYAAKSGDAEGEVKTHLGYKVAVDAAGKIYVGQCDDETWRNDSGRSTIVTTAGQVVAGTWFHLAVSVPGRVSARTTTATVCVNGAEVATSGGPFGTNLNGTTCSYVRIGTKGVSSGLGLSAAGVYVDTAVLGSSNLVIQAAANYVVAATTQYTATVSGEVAWSNLEWTPPGGGSPISTADLPESSEIHVTISSGATLTITSADVAQLTEKQIAFKTSQFTNNGTIKFTGGEKSDPIALTVDGDANIDLGKWALAADTYVKVTANGNKVYTVSGTDAASSFLEITSASTVKGVGTTEGTTFRTMTLVANVDVSSETDGFWIERAGSFDATVNLVAAQRIILYGNAQTIGSLSGSGTIDRYRDGETHRYTLTITPNADAAFTGASEHPIVIASAEGTQTIKAAKLTNNVTLDADAKLDIAGTPGLEAYVITSATFTDNGGTLTLNGKSIADAGYKVIGNKLVKVYAKTISADAKWSELWQGESLPSSAKVVLNVSKSAKLDFDTDITVESITIQSEAGAELTLALSGSLLQAKWDFSAAKGGISLDASAMDGEALARYAIAGAPYSAWLIRSEDITAGDLPAAPTAYPTLPTHYSVLASEQVAGVGVRLVIGADDTVVRASVNVNIGNPGLDGLTPYGLHPALGTIWYEYYYTDWTIQKGNFLALKTGYITVPGSSVQITPNEYYLIDTLEKTTDEQKIFKHNMQDSAGAERGFTLKGISGFAAEYRVIVYMSSDTPNWGFAPVTISENMSGTFNPVTYAGPTFQKNEVGYTIKGSKAAHWGWANDNQSHHSFDQREGVNAIVSDVMTADNIVIKTLRPSDDTLMARGSIAAIQIVKLDRDDPDAVSVTYGTAGNRLRLTTTDYRKWDTAVVPGNPTAARKSERTDRTAYVGKPTSAGGLSAQIKVFEHPELDYTQYEMTLSNSTAAAINVVAFNLWSGWTPTPVGAEGDGRINGGTQGPVAQFPSDKTYFGVENPQTDITVTDGRATAVLARNYAIKAGEAWTVRWVVGTYSEESQLRREFQAYLDNERAHPYRVFPHYNSWYDLCIDCKDKTTETDRLTEAKLMTSIKKFREKLSVERGCWMKSYLADDGWDRWYSVWAFHAGFPDGFKNVADEIHKDAGASISCWMSPCGGYGGSFNQRLKYAKDMGYVPSSATVLRLSQDGYYAPFRDRAIKMITDYDMNLFKFDRMGIGEDCTGAGSEYAPDIAAVVRLTGEMRAKKQDVFINCTVGTWASPFWVMYADSIWRGEGDYGGQGGKYTIGDTVRQRWITYRDNVIYNRFAKPNPLFPLNSMMNHGIIVTKNGTDGTQWAYSSEDTDATLQDFCDEMWMSMACGTDLQEYYISPDLMFDRWWDALATGIKWLEANQETLRDVHWVGGDPFNERYGQSTSGKQGAIYGYASWKGTKGIIVLRNSHSSTLSLTTTIANLLELPSTCDTPTVASVKRVFSHNADLSTYFKKPKTVYENVTFTLPKYDVMLIEVELSPKPRGLMLFTK